MNREYSAKKKVVSGSRLQLPQRGRTNMKRLNGIVRSAATRSSATTGSVEYETPSISTMAGDLTVETESVRIVQSSSG